MQTHVPVPHQTNAKDAILGITCTTTPAPNTSVHAIMEPQAYAYLLESLHARHATTDTVYQQLHYQMVKRRITVLQTRLDALVVMVRPKIVADVRLRFQRYVQVVMLAIKLVTMFVLRVLHVHVLMVLLLLLAPVPVWHLVKLVIQDFVLLTELV